MNEPWWAGLDPLATPLRAYLLTAAVSLVSALVPLVNIEAYLLYVALAAPQHGWPVVLLTTAGQMAGKYVLYRSGRDGLRPRAGRHAARLEGAGRVLREHRLGTSGVVAASAVLGLPPFYAVSIMAGVLHVPLGRFLAVASVGRLVRFALVFFAPGLLRGGHP